MFHHNSWHHQFSVLYVFTLFLRGTSSSSFETQMKYLGQGSYFFFDKQQNVQNKAFMFIWKGTISKTVKVKKCTENICLIIKNGWKCTLADGNQGNEIGKLTWMIVVNQ